MHPLGFDLINKKCVNHTISSLKWELGYERTGVTTLDVSNLLSPGLQCIRVGFCG